MIACKYNEARKLVNEGNIICKFILKGKKICL